LFKSLKSRIVISIILSGTILIVGVYTALYFINIKKSTEFNERKVSIFLSSIKDSEDKEKILKNIVKYDPYIRYINYNNKIFKGIDFRDTEIFKIKLDNIELSYGFHATDEYVKNLEIRMAVVAFAFYCLIFLIALFVNKLLNPFNEIVYYFESFDSENIKKLEYKTKNVSSEFSFVKKALDKMIEKMSKYKKTIETYAYYDSLTGLKNRRSYMKDIKNYTSGFSVLFLDLDSFKLINDTLGHESGDKVLKEVGKRLHEINFNETVEIYRIGGDEFILLISTDNRFEIDKYCNFIHNSLDMDFCIEDHVLNIYTSIGISIVQKEELKEGRDLLLEADIAMYEAKYKGKNQHVFFKQEMYEKIKDKLSKIREIKKAVINEEFEFVLQPQVDYLGKIYGAEALIRWNKNGKLLSPFFFIDILENSKYMIPVGNKMIENVFNFSKTLNHKIILSINLSEIQLQDKNFLMNLVKIIEKTNIDTSNFEFEITERWKSIDEDIVYTNIIGLKKLGFKLSIDDFGEDQSSFKRTDILPIDKLKLDKSFVDRLFSENNSINSISAIYAYAALERIEMVVEGVETEEQFNALLEIGLKNYQGYLFYKPMSQEEFKSLLLKNYQEYSLAPLY